MRGVAVTVHWMTIPGPKTVRTGTRERPPAVVLGAWSAGTAVIRALGRHGVPVYCVHHDDAERGRKSRYVVERIRGPHPEHHEREYLEVVRGLVARLPGAIVVPTSDETLTVISRNRTAIGESCVVACSDWEVTELFMDKARTYELAHRVGISIPQTFTVDSVTEAASAASAIGFPCLVKPRYGHRYSQRFGRKMTVVNDPRELRTAWQEAASADMEVVVQKIVEGPDSSGANYNAYVAGGRVIAECTAQKVRLNPPGYGFPRVVVSKMIPEIIATGRKLTEAMGVSGFACTEFKLDARSGVYELMELNGRHNMSSALSVACGMNFPVIMYEDLTGASGAGAPTWRSGIYWIQEPSDIVQSVRRFREERYAVRDYLRPYFRKHVFDLSDASDPGPALDTLAGKGRRAVHRIVP
jgi:predicted ATP-grasp superfamily ATP-dependent carboligase